MTKNKLKKNSFLSSNLKKINSGVNAKTDRYNDDYDSFFIDNTSVDVSLDSDYEYDYLDDLGDYEFIENKNLVDFTEDDVEDNVEEDVGYEVEDEESLDYTDDDEENQKEGALASKLQLKSIFEHSIIGPNLQHFFVPDIEIHRLTIQVASNNIFCTLKNMGTNTMFYAVSSGSYKICVTKRTIKKNTKDIIESFFKGLQERNFNYTHPVAINITAPSSFKKFILEILEVQVLSKIDIESFCYIDIKSKKNFNGCRAKKLLHRRRLNLE